MSLKIGFVMDSLDGIKPLDTTFRLMLEAQNLDHQVYYMELKDLFLRDGVAWARMREVRLQDVKNNYYEVKKDTLQKLQNLNIIFMRKDPPVDSNYIYATQILDLAEQAGVQVVNKPQSLRDYNEKIAVNFFPQCTVPTLITCDLKQLADFLQEQKDIICKPLHGMGGLMIFRVRENDPNLHVIFETLTQKNQQFIIAQRYISEIKQQGDKRIILIAGEPVNYALARFAPAGETRANLAAGGTGKIVEINERDKWICAQLKPTLQEKGLFFVGIDVIGDYLTEINITSPTCIREIENLTGFNVAKLVFDKLKEKR